ncbi:taste receptor type 1 member 2.2 [Gouania willdenowi]|nr:taste receptor type 1 member 1-like [Gouania willdenowi]
MRHLPLIVYVLGSFLNNLSLCSDVSYFHLDGDYVIGGLIRIHYVMQRIVHHIPEALDCSSQTFSVQDYRRFQIMRFLVEQINNSTTLLPNVSLGYEMFDHCATIPSFSNVLKLLSVHGEIHPWRDGQENLSRMIAVVGPAGSTRTMAVAPLFMADLIPMVNFGSTLSVFSRKLIYPSFLRTVHPNKDAVEVIVNILLHFNWHWVAFFYSDNDYGRDGLDLFRKKIKDTDICLAYTKNINENTKPSELFQGIEKLKITTIVGFSPDEYAAIFIKAAIQMNITNKVWIAVESWAMNRDLPMEKGIENIGTVLGVAQPLMSIPGFHEFLISTKSKLDSGQLGFCNQACNCDGVSDEDISRANPTFTFPLYSAIYAIAHALHNALQCGVGSCSSNITASPQMILAELRKSNFTLFNQSIQFDDNGDPKFGFYSIVFWNSSGEVQKVGSYYFHPSPKFIINDTDIQWHSNGLVPVSLCSHECSEGYSKEIKGVYKCCFTCEICSNGTYVNKTEDPYMCKACSDTEWSPEGSTRCNLRLVEYMSFTDPEALGLMVISGLLVVLTLAVCVLFAFHYNTPVVRSAGGPMCFLILGCLSLSSISVFFFFGKPSVAFCIFRFLPFLLFYTVCVSCFVVRSFQIVCIFKIAAKFPGMQSWWVKYHGQWVVISVAFVIQALVLLIGYSSDPPKPYNETEWYPTEIILSCDISIPAIVTPTSFLTTLCILCFIFSYMGKDLPKNYNEAKSITFCLMLLILTWIIFATVFMLYRGKFLQPLNAMAVLSSLYAFLLSYFLPKCYIIIFQPEKNTQQHFQGLIQNYTKTISQ